jgi:Mg2+ and Co2+ transporter CorA
VETLTSDVPAATTTGAINQPSAFTLRLARVFNDAVMGFLALAAIATALGPMVFDVSPPIERVLTFVEWAIVVAFALELYVQHAIARDRRAWWRSPWRIVDVVTVLGPVVALLPQVSDLARGSLMLRFLRVGRAVAFGTRAGSIAVREPRAAAHARYGAIPTVTVIRADGPSPPAPSDWARCLHWPTEPGGAWFHARDASGDQIRELFTTVGTTGEDLTSLMREEAPARFRSGDNHATLVLQIPNVSDPTVRAVRRDRVIAIVTERSIVTATTGSIDLHALVDLAGRAPLPALSFPATVVCALLEFAYQQNVEVSERFDDEIHRLQASEAGGVFLHETFRLRQEISAATLDLWHLKAIIRMLAEGKATLRGVDLENAPFLDELQTEIDSLYQTVDKNKEEVQTIIEFHINIKSFEMNSFLKLLAVVSFLGLIPSVVGGLLGMNVIGNPWPFTLEQVAFVVVMAMATALYVFAVKGWLR